MANQLWDGFESTLEIQIDPRDRYVPKPTPRALDAYEKTAGFQLPHSYREWALAMGPGRLVGDEFEIFAPGYKESERNASLERFDANYDGVRTMTNKELRNSNNPDLVRRLRPFGRTDRGETLGWNTDEGTDPDRHEYVVYRLERTYDVTRLASTFREFIVDYVYGPGYEALIGGWDESTQGPRRAFHPARQRSAG